MSRRTGLEKSARWMLEFPPREEWQGAVPGAVKLVHRLQAVFAFLELSAASGIRMLTPEQIEAVAQRFKLQAEDAKFFVKSLAYLGRELVGRVQVAKVAGVSILALYLEKKEKPRT